MVHLHACNQHKMGPSGVHVLLFELHTTWFNTLWLQYLEAIFECVVRYSTVGKGTLHDYIPEHFTPFGDFSDCQGYVGFVPSEYYLSDMLNKAIEHNEADANQHTSLLAATTLSGDDSFKVILVTDSALLILTLLNSSRSTLLSGMACQSLMACSPL